MRKRGPAYRDVDRSEAHLDLLECQTWRDAIDHAACRRSNLPALLVRAGNLGASSRLNRPSRESRIANESLANRARNSCFWLIISDWRLALHSLTSVPTFSPRTTRLMLPFLKRSKTTIGMLL